MAKESKSSKTKKGGKSNKKKPWYFNWFTKNVYLAAIAILLLVFAVSLCLKVITRHNIELEVPSFENMTVAAAEQVAKSHNLRVEVIDSIHNPHLKAGSVFKQNPKAGSKVKKNRRILLTINGLSPKMVPMPYLEGYSLRQAQTELEAAQLVLGKLVYVEDIANNNVIKQFYKGRRIKPGTLIPAESEISLEVGRNSEQVSETVVIEPSENTTADGGEEAEDEDYF